MKQLAFCVIFLLRGILFSQGSAAFVDDRDFFFTYMNGAISKQEILKIDTFMTSYNYVTYIDRYGNFKLIHNHKKYTIYPITPDKLKVSNYLMAYMRGGQLGVFNGRQSKMVEPFTRGDFKLGDSVIAYINNFDILKVYVYDTTYELMNFALPEHYTVGENIVGIKTIDDRLKAFYQGKIMELEPYFSGEYKIARDMMVYHDNLMNFKVFERGNTYTLEQYKIEDFELTNNVLTYYSNVGEWFVYSNEEKKLLLNTKPKSVLQKRNILAYSDNAGNFFVYYKGKLKQLENYTPTKIDAWEDVLVYADIYNVLWGLVKGEKVKISEGIVKEWWMQNRCVVYFDLTPNVKSVWDNGKIYTYSLDNDPNRK